MIKENRKLFLPLIVFFLTVNGLSVSFSKALAQRNLDIAVVIVANTLLFFICTISLLMQLKGAKNTNPHAMVRGVMSSVVLKLFVLGTAVFLYLYIAGENKSINALFVSMALYLFYTWLEVRISLKINPPKDGGN